VARCVHPHIVQRSVLRIVLQLLQRLNVLLLVRLLIIQLTRVINNSYLPLSFLLRMR
jgi:hypothetical protein